MALTIFLLLLQSSLHLPARSIVCVGVEICELPKSGKWKVRKMCDFDRGTKGLGLDPQLVFSGPLREGFTYKIKFLYVNLF